MAGLMCCCGGRMHNGGDDDTEWAFLPFDAIRLSANEDCDFFDLDNSVDGALDIWKCHDCDNLTVFENHASAATVFFARCATDDARISQASEPDKVPGIIYNDLFIDDVGQFFERKDEGYCLERPITIADMEREVFSDVNGRFRNWWYAAFSRKQFLFFRDKEMTKPVKAWYAFEPKDEIARD